MRFEKGKTDSFIVLEPGDHEQLGVSKVVSLIPMNSEQLDLIEKDLEDGIKTAHLIYRSYRRNHRPQVFTVHGEMLTMQGIYGEIQSYREQASSMSQHDPELWGSVCEESPIDYSEPQLSVISNPNPIFDPEGPFPAA